MLIQYFKIRLLQISRGVKDIGIFRILFLFFIAIFLVLTIFKLSEDSEKSYYISTIFIFIILTFHINRQDKLFLKTNINNYKLLFFIEYILLSFPIIICFTINSQLIQLLILIFSLIILSQLDLNIKLKNKNFKILKLIPDNCFEWKSGIRKLILFILPLWIIGILCSFFVATIPVIIFILGILPLSFYAICEPYQMIILFEKKSSNFLITKIKLQLLLFTCITTPLIILFILFHNDLWYIVVAEYLIFISIHIYQILAKYAFYESNEKSSPAQIFEAIAILGIFIPLFIPLIWLLSIRFYIKAKNKLNIYLNDFN